MGKHRRRKRLNPRFLVLVALAFFFLGLLIFGVPSCFHSTEPEETTTEPTEDTTQKNGWMEENGLKYYVNQDGSRATGWMELDGRKYLLDSNGFIQTGWINDLYFLEDGSMATGKVEIAGTIYFFTSQGKSIIIANPWNPIPEDYAPDLVPLGMDISVEGSQVDKCCYDALVQMLSDCNKECPQVCVVSSYRTHEYQTNSYNRKVQYYLSLGYSQDEAQREAATIIAVPGTSEHQLGLAVDIIDTRLWALEEEQADLPAQQWLMENSWRYGFILRYPKDKIHETGIIYEPWHYRYVGIELAAELHDLGITLEAYLQNLTR